MTAERVADAKGNLFELRRIGCPICGTRRTRTLGLRGGKHQRYGLGIVTSIVECRNCTLVYPDPFPFPVDAQELYADPEKYFSGHDEEAKVASYRTLVRAAATRAGKSAPSILDVGTGRAELLRAAVLEGFTQVVGLEFADAMIEHARGHGIAVEKASIDEYAARTDRTFDVVFLNAVLEHVYDPDAMIAASARLVTPGGLLYIDVPRDPNLLTSVAHIVNRLRGSQAVLNLSPTWPPYHVFGFTERSLGRLLAKHAFAVENLEIRSSTTMPHDGTVRDRAKAFAASAIYRLANRTGRAANMFVWARRR